MFDKTTLQNLYRYSYALTGNEANAYDLLQCAIEKFLNSGPVSGKSFVYIKRIIRNQFIDDYRRERRLNFESFEEDVVFNLDFSARALESMVIDENMIETIMLFLTAEEREIVYYWAYEGFTTEEIAAELNMPRGTVLSKIHRIRNKVTEKFDIDSTVLESSS